MSFHSVHWLVALVVIVVLCVGGVRHVYVEQTHSMVDILSSLPSAAGHPPCSCYATLSIPNMSTVYISPNKVALEQLPPRCPEEHCATSDALAYCSKLDELPSSPAKRRTALDALGAQVLARGTHKEVYLIDDYVIKLPSPKAASVTAYIVDGTIELTTYGALLATSRALVLSPVLAICATGMVQASPVLPLNILVERLQESKHPLTWLVAATVAVSASSAWSLLLAPPIPVQVCDFRAHSAGINPASFGIEFLDLGWMRPLSEPDRVKYANVSCETAADCSALPHVQNHCPVTCTSTGRCAYSASRAVGSFSREVVRPLLNVMMKTTPTSVTVMEHDALHSLDQQLHALHDNQINYAAVEENAVSIEGAGPMVEQLVRPLYERLRDSHLTPANMNAMQELLVEWLSGWKKVQATRCANGKSKPKPNTESVGVNRHSVCV